MRVQEAATPIIERRSNTNPAANDERLLVTKAKSGGSGAFGELYERHRTRVYRTAFRILRNAQDAEDAVQRSFQRAFVNLSRFRGDSAFSTWLTRIAMNEALMMLRQRRSDVRFFEYETNEDYEFSVSNFLEGGPTPEEILTERELRAVLIQAVSQLRKSLRSAILPQLQGLTMVETARHLGVTVSAVKARMFHAKRQLRQHLERRLQVPQNGFCSKF
jgi:RNA polymerase sigma-70 factor (ECF subfamily)